jgi:large subunit ribosomal protein L10
VDVYGKEVTLLRKAEKEQLVAEMQTALDEARHLVISTYRGLTVKDITELRRAIRSAGGRMRVVKKTLFRRALEGREEAGLGEHMEGPVAVTFVSGDLEVLLKEMESFAGRHEELEFRAGWIDSQLFDGGQVAQLASLPSREVLLAQLLSALSGPLTQLVTVLEAVPRDLVLTLQALADQHASHAPATA